MTTAAAPAVQYRSPERGTDAGFSIPVQWPLTADPEMKRREPVLDVVNHNRPVRLVGWKRCLLCRSPFWSEDVRRNHICKARHFQIED
jgi:hypothetical protein